MFEPLILHVSPVDDGRWQVALHHPSRCSSWAEMSAEQVARLVEDVTVALSPDRLPAMLPPNRDAPFVAQEERAGRALARTLHASVAMTTALAEARLCAQQAGTTVAIAVCAQGRASELPWELLADAPDGVGLAATGTAVIVRLVGAGAPLQARFGAWSWDAVPLDPQDAAVTRLLAELGRVADEEGLADRQDTEGPRLQVLAGHGERDLAVLSMRTAAGPVAAPSALAGVSLQADLGVLAVCDAAPREGSLVSEPVDLLLRAGWDAVIAPRGRVLMEGCGIFCEALIRALGSGASALVATEEARRALRARALAMPEGRWHHWMLHISDLRHVTEAVGPSSGILRGALGWPRLSRPAEAHVAQAIRIAERLESGFLGVEHLALALVQHPPETATFPWRAQLVRIRELIGRTLAGFSPVADVDPRPTPRLLALAGALSAGATLGDLWEVLQQAPVWYRVYATSRWPGPALRNGETLRTLPTPDAGAAAATGLALEVLGGPEDGRVLQPVPGDVLGRGDNGPRTTLQLYQTTGAFDGWLSRTHLEFLGAMRMRAVRRVELVSGGESSTMPAGAERELAPEDVLKPTAYTTLLVKQGPA